MKPGRRSRPGQRQRRSAQDLRPLDRRQRRL